MNPWIKQIYTIGKPFTYHIDHIDYINKKVVSNDQIHVDLVCDATLKDQFVIRTFSTGDLVIRYGNHRSLNYALSALDQEKNQLKLGIYEGGPDFEIRGIIEGFYGTPWRHEDRMDVISFIHKYRMNSYFYAPKDDPYHRQLWREPYPEKELEKLLELVNHANDSRVDFYFCISPGNDFIYTKQDEFESLFRKIDHLIHHGVKHFSLLMDDIDYVLKDESLERFQRPGVAHAYISNRLNRYLASKLTEYTFVMCPTEYWQNWDTEYRKDLREGLDPEILVFWTGYNTVAEYIPNEDGCKAKAFFGHPLILWDNYPVNDMAFDHLFMGPLVNRGKKLGESHVGMLSNPMVSWHLSKVAVITMADYMWNSALYDPEKSYQEALLDLANGDHKIYEAMKIFADENRPSLIHYHVNQKLDSMIEKLDMNELNRYFNRVNKAMNVLIKQSQNVMFKEDALPWIKRFKKDYRMWNKLKNNKATKDDFTYISEAKHVMGYQVLARVAAKMGLYDGKIYKKERPNFWDNPKVRS
jgi:hyaluronoglucosaminidase